MFLQIRKEKNTHHKNNPEKVLLFKQINTAAFNVLTLAGYKNVIAEMK
jgi:hypothetical protein